MNKNYTNSTEEQSYFIKHTSCNSCGSSDGNAVYSNNSSFCFVCKAVSQPQLNKKLKEKKLTQPQKPKIQDDILHEILENCRPYTIDKKGFRGIRDEITLKYGVQNEYKIDSSDTFVLDKRYYPVTQGGEHVGYKVRTLPKVFSAIGRNSKNCDLFGQSLFKELSSNKYILLTEGEEDAMAAYQMLHDYRTAKGSPFETAVVSTTVGAQGIEQVSNNYKFLDNFNQIIVCYDNDDTGKEVVEKLIPVLPKGKVKVMKLRHKDANEYLMKGAQDDFVRAFYNAEQYIPVNVMGSRNLMKRILDQVNLKKVPFPGIFTKLNKMLIGGVPLGHIVNIAAKTSIGKTTLVNELVYYWIFNSPHKIGVVSMELDAGQYGEVLLSRHLEQKLSLIEDDISKTAMLNSETVQKKQRDLFLKIDENTGEEVDRFYLVDNRDGSLDELKDTIEEMVVSCQCKIVVIDPLQDLLDGCTVDDQALFMAWQKGMIMSHNCTFININHMRKSEAGSVEEDNIQGSSTISKSASFNIILNRDKQSECDITRNTTKVNLAKNRVYGMTGNAGAVYYDNATHKLYDLDEWLNDNVDKIPPEYYATAEISS